MAERYFVRTTQPLKKVAVLFTPDVEYYLTGFRDQPTHIRGMVTDTTGEWPLYGLKNRGRVALFRNATSARTCLGPGYMGTLDMVELSFVELPSTLLVDPITAKNWARHRARQGLQ